MLTVTESAKKLLKQTLQEHSDDPETGIRLSVKEGGQFGIVLDSESEGDQVVEHDGDKVLLVSPGLATALEGSRLDVQDTDEGPKLFITKEKQNSSND
jgi:Fe-S cluster assembly iron-binding protein IscA